MYEREETSHKFSRRKFLLGSAATIISGSAIYRSTISDSDQPSLLESLSSRELVKELEDPFKIEDPDTGQKLNVVLLNRAQIEEGKPLIITSETYGSTIEDQTKKLGLGLIAERTNYPVLAFDRYETGQSDPLTKEQIESILAEEGLLQIAKAVARSLRNFNIPSTQTQVEVANAYIAGYSMGASMGSALLPQAEDAGIKIKKAILVEPVGVANFNWEELAYRFVYGNSQLNPRASVAAATILEASRSLMDSPTDPHFYYSRAIAQDFVPGDLATALTTNEHLTILVGYGTESALCPEKNVQTMIDDLNSQFENRVINYPFKGDAHEIFGRQRSWSMFLRRQLI